MNTRYAGMPGYLPVDSVRAHLQHLVDDLGLPCASIARDTGLCGPAVVDIYLGTFPTVRIRAADALHKASFRPNERQGRVLGIGAARRLHALHRIGWPFNELAARCGLSIDRVQVLARRTPRIIPWPVWKAIYDIYTQLSGTPGPSERARLYGARRHWPSTLDWEDLDIDDPRVEVTPCTAEPPPALGKAEAADARAAEVQELTRKRLSAREIADRMGIDKRTVVRLRGRELTDNPVLTDHG
jgi:hypothetical protein